MIGCRTPQGEYRETRTFTTAAAAMCEAQAISARMVRLYPEALRMGGAEVGPQCLVASEATPARSADACWHVGAFYLARAAQADGEFSKWNLLDRAARAHLAGRPRVAA